jgi:hypothetical protein
MDDENRSPASPNDDGLSFVVELAGPDGGQPQLMARAASATLGRAIFEAASVEHPGRRIILRQGSRVLAERPASRAEPFAG